MAVKRRVVWFSDEEWLILNARAKKYGMSVSLYIRVTMIDGATTDEIRGALYAGSDPVPMADPQRVVPADKRMIQPTKKD